MATNASRVGHNTLTRATGDVQDLLHGAQQLIQKALYAHQGVPTEDLPRSVGSLAHGTELGANLRSTLLEAAGKTVRVGYIPEPSADPWSATHLSMLERYLSDVPLDLRTLVAAEQVDRAMDWMKRIQIRAGRDFEVRALNDALPPLTVVDSVLVLIGPDMATTGQYIAVWDRPVVELTGKLFEALFNSATALSCDVGAETGNDLHRDDVDRLVKVLTLLDRGHTDEKAARNLGVSVRTFRRYVAQAMDWLGASSRFQAGARAASLGLIRSQ